MRRQALEIKNSQNNYSSLLVGRNSEEEGRFCADVETWSWTAAVNSWGVSVELNIMAGDDEKAETAKPDTDPTTVRRVSRATVSRHLGQLSRLVTEESDQEVITKLDTLKTAFAEFENAHDNFHGLLTKEKDITESEKWFVKAEQDYIKGVKQARSWLKSIAEDSEPSEAAVSALNLSTSSKIDTSELIDLLSTPNVDIDFFHGDPNQFPSFIATFDDNIDSKNIGDQRKLTRLLYYCKGSAKTSIKNTALIGGAEGYSQARQILRERFGNKHLVSRNIISSLKRGDLVNTGYELRQLCDDLTLAEKSLTDLEMLVEIDNVEAIHEILERCPSYVIKKWRNRALKAKREKGAYPAFSNFVKFIKELADDACDPVFGNEKYMVKRREPTKSASHAITGTSNFSSATGGASNFLSASRGASNFSGGSRDGGDQRVRVNESSRTQTPCVLCNASHPLYSCDSFKAMRPQARFDTVRRHRLCFMCFSSAHQCESCARLPCNVSGCGRRHSRLLHVDRTSDGGSRGNNQGDRSSDGGSRGNNQGNRASDGGTRGNNQGNRNGPNGNCFANTGGSSVYMPMVRVIVNGKVDVLCLLDTGSNHTFINESVAQQLNISGTPVNYRMSTISGTESTDFRSVSLEVTSTENGHGVSLSNVLVVNQIPARYPSTNVKISDYPYLEGIPLPRVSLGTKADMIIGMDNSHLLAPLDVRRDPLSQNLPYATRTVLGWSLNGPVPGSQSEVISQFVTIHDQVENLWKIERADDEVEGLSVEDKRVLEYWDNNTIFEDGKYVVPIPFVNETPGLPFNKASAYYRLQGLLKRLEKSGKSEQYCENMVKVIENGWAERVPADEQGNVEEGAVFYLPHHPVENPHKPGKMRIVLDCAAKCKGVCLNDVCHRGPSLISKLVGVLLRFRQFQYAISCDLQSMYMSVFVPQSQRNCLKFLWYDDGEIVEWRMTRHVFGGVWSGSACIYALQRIAEDFACSEAMVSMLHKSFYVDDMLRSVVSVPEGVEIIEACQSLDSQNFHATKYTVSDDKLMECIPVEDRAGEVKEFISSETSSRALGVLWSVQADVFYYEPRQLPDGVVTRREMLKFVASLYDPLGLILPVIQRGKMYFQLATRHSAEWDVEVPCSLKGKWRSWLSSLEYLGEIKFPRCLIPSEFVEGAASLHIFCDGSLSGFGAVAYLRVGTHTGRIRVVLVASKGRLAPLKAVTIPRLELCAAVTAVNLDIMLRQELDIPLLPSTFWTDSTIVLAYLRNEARRFKVFVANRVGEITRNSSVQQWRHIEGVINPADVLSRGSDANTVPDSWYSGPSFLATHQSEWPDMSVVACPALDSDPEVCVSAISSQVSSSQEAGAIHPIDVLAGYYSSFYRLMKVVCWFLRYREFLRGRVVSKGCVTVTEMNVAEKLLVEHVQGQVYEAEMSSLVQRGEVLVSSSIRKLSPCLQDGIIVVGGRLRHATLSSQARFPIIMPREHRISQLIVMEYHNSAHLGSEWTLSRLRTKYWVINARNMIRQVRKECMVCKRLFASTSTQLMADLPPERCLAGSPPFSHVGLDVFGNFYVKQGRAEVKRYACIYTCFSTRAVHLELLSSLSSDDLICSFMRFSARRGYPVRVMSDNGTNMVGAQAELARGISQLDKDKVVQAARRCKVEWVFNPPFASHHGGVWERVIRTVRQVLAVLLRENPRLTNDKLHTILCEAENIVNSRPICKVSSDPDDLSALTPNHLLIMKDNSSFPWADVKLGETYRRQWRHAQHVADVFWKRWTKEYIVELQRRSKWTKTQRNIQKGDVVLLVDESVHRGAWPLALVIEVKQGRDGLVRSARLRTKSTELVRPITKLVMLEECHED